MNELIKVTQNQQHQQVVSARELHDGLEVKTRFSLWVKQNFTDFDEGADFCPVVITTQQNQHGGIKELDDYALTIDMAKQLAMMSHMPKGAEYRRYFLEVERKWNDPAEVIKRGYAFLQDENYQLHVKNTKLSLDNQTMVPKAQYFDELVEKDTLTNFRDTAKMIGRRQTEFIDWLLDKKFVYRDAHKKLKPVAAYAGTYFVIKDNAKGFPQTMITPQGRAAFNRLFGSGNLSEAQTA